MVDKRRKKPGKTVAIDTSTPAKTSYKAYFLIYGKRPIKYWTENEGTSEERDVIKCGEMDMTLLKKLGALVKKYINVKKEENYYLIYIYNNIDA